MEEIQKPSQVRTHGTGQGIHEGNLLLPSEGRAPASSLFISKSIRTQCPNVVGRLKVSPKEIIREGCVWTPKREPNVPSRVTGTCPGDSALDNRVTLLSGLSQKNQAGIFKCQPQTSSLNETGGGGGAMATTGETSLRSQGAGSPAPRPPLAPCPVALMVCPEHPFCQLYQLPSAHPSGFRNRRGYISVAARLPFVVICYSIHGN